MLDDLFDQVLDMHIIEPLIKNERYYVVKHQPKPAKTDLQATLKASRRDTKNNREKQLSSAALKKSPLRSRKSLSPSPTRKKRYESSNTISD